MARQVAPIITPNPRLCNLPSQVGGMARRLYQVRASCILTLVRVRIPVTAGKEGAVADEQVMRAARQPGRGPVEGPMPPPHGPLLQRIQESRSRAVQQVRRLRRRSNWLTYSAVVCSSLATLIAGWAAAFGPAIGEGTPAWRLTCGVVALFTATATGMGGIQQGTQVADRLSKAVSAAGKLNALELALTLGSRDAGDIVKEYQEVLAENESLLH